jgi:hypothetical protein
MGEADAASAAAQWTIELVQGQFWGWAGLARRIPTHEGAPQEVR